VWKPIENQLFHHMTLGFLASLHQLSTFPFPRTPFGGKVRGALIYDATRRACCNSIAGMDGIIAKSHVIHYCPSQANGRSATVNCRVVSFGDRSESAQRGPWTAQAYDIEKQELIESRRKPFRLLGHIYD
jgi:hypothetical protein